MEKLKPFVVWIFSDANDLDTKNGKNTMKCAHNPDETASFDSPEEAQAEMRERCVDYGALVQIYDLDSATVLWETTDGGRTWYDQRRAPFTAETVAA